MEKEMWRSVTLFIFLSWAAATARFVAPVYKAVGENVTLTLSPSKINLSDPITSIVWKHGPNVAVEWNGRVTLTYHPFEGRSVLNSSTGALTITGLTRNDSGSYTPEINGQVTKAIQFHVISPVPEPTISTWCHDEMTYCVLTCEGNTTGAEPVTYSWGTTCGFWGPSTKMHKITGEEHESLYRCSFENPVSRKGSDFVRNPLAPPAWDWPLAYLIMSGVVILLIGAIVFVYIRRKAQDAKDAPPEYSAMTSRGQPAVDEEAADGSQKQSTLCF